MLMAIIAITVATLFYAPTETADMVICKITGSGPWTLHTDTGLYTVEKSYLHGEFHPEELAAQIQAPGEYELKYYGMEAHLGRVTRHPIVLDATLVKANVTSNAPICNE